MGYSFNYKALWLYYKTKIFYIERKGGHTFSLSNVADEINKKRIMFLKTISPVSRTDQEMNNTFQI